jgi:nucleotide-binding universal stress UspA family protein
MNGYRDIVVDACPRPRVRQTLAFARDVARTFDARLSVKSYAWPRTSIKELLIRDTMPDQEKVTLMKRELAASRRAFDEVFAAAAGGADWDSAIGDPTLEMQPHLLTADLLITDPTGSEACEQLDPARIALECGIAVLRMGREPHADLASVVVGWKDTAQARRAVHDALPILARAQSVVVAGVGDEVATGRLEAVAAHLHRHSVKARALHVADTAGDVCSSLLELAEREGAQLVVSGAFSRGPWAQRVLGGVTSSMLGRTDMAWFTSR